MYSVIKSGAIHGVDGQMIYVEADVSDGLPALSLVGLLSSEVREAGERVKNALKNSGFRMPPKHITVNLSPADVRKAGSGFDLSIAIAILCAYEYINSRDCREYLFLGELGLDGMIKPVRGILPIVDAAYSQGIRKCIVPLSNLSEAKLVENMDACGAASLKDIISYFLKKEPLYTEAPEGKTMTEKDSLYDFSDIRGQSALKRAVTVAASGMHNILIGGAPGTGKSMIAKRIPSILPELTYSESMELTKIYSAAGYLKASGELMKNRPFRSPHHTISNHGLIGGGLIPRPGEISLAHSGVLFLDEFPEFSRNVLEVLRQPLEDRKTTISRVGGVYTFPADFMLVAAMNLCPCGNYPDTKRCRCSVYERRRYLNRISQPILDRMDIQVYISPVKYDDLYEDSREETSEQIREKVTRVHEIQHERYREDGILFNSQLEGRLLKKYCCLDAEGSRLLKCAHERLNLSARADLRILKTARTIADLEGAERISAEHLSEAVSYRGMEGL